MPVVLLGPPGSGKGTQAKNFVTNLSYVHLATGDLLRSEVAADTNLGKNVKFLIESGKYVPDEIVFSLLEKKVESISDKEKVVFDGFPRTLNQIELLKKLLQKFDINLKKVFNINVADETIVGRAVQRMVCPGCFSVYNKVTTPPKKEGVCDVCDTTLCVRADDDEETVRNRLKVYHNAAGPIIAFFKSDEILVGIDGSLSNDKVWESISSYL
jgi:adenylate kinase